MKILTKKITFLHLPVWVLGGAGVGGFFLFRYHSQNGYWPWQKNQATSQQGAATSPLTNPDLAFEPMLGSGSGGGGEQLGGSGPNDDLTAGLLAILNGLLHPPNERRLPKQKIKPPKKKPPEKAGPGPTGDKLGRSNTKVKHDNGGREKAASKGTETLTRPRGNSAPPQNKHRQRPTKPVVADKGNVLQHPKSSHPSRNQSVRPNHPTPRPSAPPPRTQRARGK